MKKVEFLYVYILECADAAYYVGVTNNPARRLQEHNGGLRQKAYTYSRRPCKMIYQEMYSDFYKAIAREKQIKRWGRAKKEALMAKDFGRLHQLAACQNGTHYKNAPPGLDSARPDGVGGS